MYRKICEDVQAGKAVILCLYLKPAQYNSYVVFIWRVKTVNETVVTVTAIVELQEKTRLFSPLIQSSAFFQILS
jgi:hypothetical protein